MHHPLGYASDNSSLTLLDLLLLLSVYCELRCRHLSYFAGQQSPVESVLDLWQVVVSDVSSTQINLVDVLRRLSMYDVADAVQQELDHCRRHHQRHPSCSRTTLHRLSS